MPKSVKQKNPLAVCWGMLLRKTRESRSWEYVDIQRMSGISTDFYRNIEKAVFNLHVSQSIPLYQTFENDVIGETFKLDGIIQILSLISIMEAKANDRTKKFGKASNSENVGYYSKISQCAVDLSENSKKIKKLFSKFFAADLFSGDDVSANMVTKIEKAGLVYEMEDFVVHYDQYGEEEGNEQDTPEIKYIDNFFDNIPSIYTDLFIETKRNLVNLPVRMIFSELQKWEISNQSKIKELFVVINSKFDVTQINNLETYQYTYLFQQDFERARFLIVDNKMSASQLKAKFDKNLYTAYENVETKIPRNWKDGLSKIQFKVVKTLPEDLRKALTLNAGLENEQQYEVFWVFKFIDKSLVAFVANAVKANNFETTNRYIFNEGRSLFIKEILPRYPLLKKYFSK